MRFSIDVLRWYRKKTDEYNAYVSCPYLRIRNNKREDIYIRNLSLEMERTDSKTARRNESDHRQELKQLQKINEHLCYKKNFFYEGRKFMDENGGAENLQS
jgi:hypothetical protein